MAPFLNSQAPFARGSLIPMPSQPIAIVILAAGKGTRMRSERPKVLHSIAWRPMIAHVIDATSSVGVARRVIVVGHGAESVREAAIAAAAGTPLDVVE